MKNIIIFGATSKIAHCTARLFAAEGDQLFLVARDSKKLELIANDLKARGAKSVVTHTTDLADTTKHSECISFAVKEMGQIDICLIAHGVLSNQAECEEDTNETINQININGLSYISLMSQIGQQMQSQKVGVLAVISSVAGDRGRQSNYVYGAAKSLVSTFAEGMAHRFAQFNIDVILIKPGFVDTPMTAEFPKGPIWASPESVADGIYKAISRPKHVVYLPFFWRYIMLVIKHVPNWLMHKTKL